MATTNTPSNGGSVGNLLPGMVIGSYLSNGDGRVMPQPVLSKPSELKLVHVPLKIDERNEMGSIDTVSQPEVSSNSVDILLGPKGSNQVNIQSEGQGNATRTSQESSINFRINNDEPPRVWAKETKLGQSSGISGSTNLQNSANVRETSSFILTKPKQFNVKETALFARTKPQTSSNTFTDRSPTSRGQSENVKAKEVKIPAGIKSHKINGDVQENPSLTFTKTNDSNTRGTEVHIGIKPQNSNVMRTISVSGSSPHNINVRTLAPPGGSPPNQQVSPPVSFQGEVRGHFTLFAPPPAFQDSSTSSSTSSPPSATALPSLRPVSPRSMLTGSAGGPHFRFSPSLTRRRPCRLQTVPEAPSSGQDENYSKEGSESGLEEEEEEDEGNPVPSNRDASQLFTSVVNFKLDRDGADAACGGHVQEDGTRAWDARRERPGSTSPSRRRRSQESNVLQTELRLQPLVSEDLATNEADQSNLNSPKPWPQGVSYSPPELRESDISELPPPDLEPEARSPPDLTSAQPEVGLVVEGGEGYDRRRRQSYRISAISDDGFRAWTQNERRNSAENGHVANGSGDPYVGVNGNDDDDVPYMEKLKNVASRLKLSTRRPSVQAWRERVVGKPAGTWKNVSGSGGKKKSSLQDFGDVVDESDSSQWAEDRLDRVNEALSWIRRELVSYSIFT